MSETDRLSHVQPFSPPPLSWEWCEALVDVEKIIKMMENCDKNCRTCNKDQKNDCMIEIRECVHGLAFIVKNAILSFVEVIRSGGGEKREEMVRCPLYWA